MGGRGRVAPPKPHQGNIMRLRLTLASAVGLFLLPAAAHAQTVDIQREVEAKLWIQRVLARIQVATGAPPVVSIMILVALAIVIAASIWRWQSRRRNVTE
jgi:hypothetical protein